MFLQPETRNNKLLKTATINCCTPIINCCTPAKPLQNRERPTTKAGLSKGGASAYPQRWLTNDRDHLRRQEELFFPPAPQLPELIPSVPSASPPLMEEIQKTFLIVLNRALPPNARISHASPKLAFSRK